jgi:Flp pilus assembly secretin CpaC
MRLTPFAFTVLWLCCSADVFGQPEASADPTQTGSSASASDDGLRARRAELERKLAEVERLQGEISDLRRELGAPQQFRLKVQMLEVQHSKLTDVLRDQVGLKPEEHGSRVKPVVLAAEERPADDADAPPNEINRTQRVLETIRVLRSGGAITVLAEPELVVTDGVPARLLSGGEFPVSVPQPAGGVRAEWREFGVQLEALAKTAGDGRAQLQITVENSERDFSGAVALGGVPVPGLSTTRTNSRVDVRLGEPLVICGMLSQRERNGTAETVETVVIVTLDEHGHRDSKP